MRSVALRAFWSLTSSLTSVAVGLVALSVVYFLYILAWQRAAVPYTPVGPTPNQLSGWEAAVFEVISLCLVLGAATGTIALSLWLTRRLSGWTLGTVACTLFLIGLVALPVLSLASVLNCLFVENFPLPVHYCGE